MSEQVEVQIPKVKGRAMVLKTRGRNGVYHAGFVIETKNPKTGSMETIDYLGKQILTVGDELEVCTVNHPEPFLVVLTKVDPVRDHELEIHKARKLMLPGVVK